MWLTDRRPPSAVAAAGMHRLRTRIKKRSSKYTFYQPKSKRKDAGSERVDWVFVGFPSSSSSASNAAADLDDAPLTFEPLRPRPPSASADLRPSASSQFVSPSAIGTASIAGYSDYPGPLDPEYTSRSWSRQEPIGNAAMPTAASMGFGDPLPPPLPPRGKRSSQRPPPPRPASLYASLNRVALVQPNPADEYAQIIRSSRKRPKSSEMPCSAVAAANLSSSTPPPPIPRHMHGTGVPFPLPDSPPNNPPSRHMHGTGVPIPLPDSPPAPPLPPHATNSPLSPSLPPIESMAVIAPKEPPSLAAEEIRTTPDIEEPPSLLAESLTRNIDSPFYRRPMSLASSSLARSLSMQSKSSSALRNAAGAPGAINTHDRNISMRCMPATMTSRNTERSYDSVHFASSSLSDVQALLAIEGESMPAM